VAEPPCPELAALAARVGPVEAAERVLRGAVCAQLARDTEARRDIDCTAEDLDRIDRLGGRLVTPDELEWPALALTAFNGVDPRCHPASVAPLALWVLGGAQIDEVTLRAAAVVGTRAATVYGEHVAADLAAGLCERGVAVVCGGSDMRWWADPPAVSNAFAAAADALTPRAKAQPK
jgi:DNA processing protein